MMEKIRLDFQMQNFMLNFLKKNNYEKSNILEALQTLKIFGVAISSNINSFRFLPISGHFRTSQKNLKIVHQKEKN